MSEDAEATAAEVSWAGYRRLVLDGLERIERKIADVDMKIDREISGLEAKSNTWNKDQDKAIQALEIDVGKLKVWATLSGTVAAAIVTTVAQFLLRAGK